MNFLTISKLNCFAEISEGSYNDDTHIESIEALTYELKVLLHKYGLEYDSIETTFLNKTKYSIVRCGQCNHLMIDRVANPVKAEIEDLVADIIFDGAKLDEEYYCEDCLPTDHRWSTR